MTVKLYSTGCSKCIVLEKKLEQASIPYEKISDFDKKELMTKGFLSMPVLVVDDQWMDFKQAVDWVAGR